MFCCRELKILQWTDRGNLNQSSHNGEQISAKLTSPSSNNLHLELSFMDEWGDKNFRYKVAYYALQVFMGRKVSRIRVKFIVQIQITSFANKGENILHAKKGVVVHFFLVSQSLMD